jgi:hypothetical protein
MTGIAPTFHLTHPLGRGGLLSSLPAPSALLVRFLSVHLYPFSHHFFTGSFEALSLGDTGTEFSEESLEYVVNKRSEDERVLDAASRQLASILAAEYSELVAVAGGDVMRETLVGGVIGIHDGCVTEELVEYARDVILLGD